MEASCMTDASLPQDGPAPFGHAASLARSVRPARHRFPLLFAALTLIRCPSPSNRYVLDRVNPPEICVAYSLGAFVTGRSPWCWPTP
jgi:hypothetical protein